MVLRFVQKLIRRPWLVALGVVVLVVTMGAASVSRVRDQRRHPRRLQRPFPLRRRAGLCRLRESDRHRGGLRGGTAPELYERLRQRGRGHARRRAGHHRPREPVARRGLRTAPAGRRRPRSRRNVPAELHDSDEEWWALSTRLRIPVVSTERVAAGAVTSYDDLGDPNYKAAPACGRRTTSTTNPWSPT